MIRRLCRKLQKPDSCLHLTLHITARHSPLNASKSATLLPRHLLHSNGSFSTHSFCSVHQQHGFPILSTPSPSSLVRPTNNIEYPLLTSHNSRISSNPPGATRDLTQLTTCLVSALKYAPTPPGPTEVILTRRPMFSHLTPVQLLPNHVAPASSFGVPTCATVLPAFFEEKEGNDHALCAFGLLYSWLISSIGHVAHFSPQLPPLSRI